MRPGATTLAAVSFVACLAAAVAVGAPSRSTANGLPPYTDGYAKWTKLNRRPVTTPGAHTGVKNVYASRPRSGKAFPNGTVVVKTIVKPGTSYVGQVAVMRKVRGTWQYVEYDRSSASGRYAVFAKGQLCQACHVQAKAKDYVFTTR